MNWWTMGRELEQELFEWRSKGMNGSNEERDYFLKEVFHGVRFNGRVAILAAPSLGKTQQEVLDVLKSKVVEASAEQARETGYDERQTEMYVDAHRRAYESLAEEFGLN